jgi:CelD/BcsL family acetyltransferase involved in cellulose biosynthesis
MHLEWITDPARFSALAPEWDALAAEHATPFLLHAWLAPWWEAFAPADAELRVAVLWRDGELVAGLPLMAVDGALEALANWHTPVFGAIARDAEAEQEVALQALGAARRLEVPFLERTDALEAAAASAGRPYLVEPMLSAPVVELRGGYDAFRAESKPRWGAPLERFRRKMGRENGLVQHLVERPRDLDAELDRGFVVEASGWKGEQGTAINSQPATERFYRDVARAFADRDGLRLSWLELDGTMAAFDLTLLHANRLWLLKTGFDERHRRLAPGLVLRLSVIERCCELGLEAHELLGGESGWKAKFASTARDLAAFRGYARGPAGRSVYAYRRYGRPLLKRTYQRLRPAG